MDWLRLCLNLSPSAKTLACCGNNIRHGSTKIGLYLNQLTFIIQAGHPVFGLVWIGSVFALVAAAILAFLQNDGLVPTQVVASAVVYTLGVQLPTFLINVPLNNALQMLNVDDMDELMLASERRSFENRWVRWNLIRTAFVSGVSVSLMLVLLWL